MAMAFRPPRNPGQFTGLKLTDLGDTWDSKFKRRKPSGREGAKQASGEAAGDHPTRRRSQLERRKELIVAVASQSFGVIRL
jgi:hypothetical protein